MMAGKRGRPPLPDGQSKSEILTLRLSPQEAALLAAEAKAAGTSVSEFARLRLTQALQSSATRMEFRLFCGDKVISSYSGVALPKVLRFLADDLESGG